MEPILDQKTHLAIYTISPQMPVKPITPTTKDQFGQYEQVVLGPVFLAVPSIKTKWEPAK